MKEFGFEILYLGGRYLLNFVRRNFPCGTIPSRATILKHAFDMAGPPLLETGFLMSRFQHVAEFFKRIGYPLPFVTLSSDATALIPRLYWRACDDVIVGFAVPDEELPLADIRAGRSLEDLLPRLRRYGIATQVDVLLVNPLLPGFPSVILAVFSQKSSPDADGVARRWAIASRYLAEHGLHVVSCASQ